MSSCCFIFWNYKFSGRTGLNKAPELDLLASKWICVKMKKFNYDKVFVKPVLHFFSFIICFFLFQFLKSLNNKSLKNSLQPHQWEPMKMVWTIHLEVFAAPIPWNWSFLSTLEVKYTLIWYSRSQEVTWGHLKSLQEVETSHSSDL